MDDEFYLDRGGTRARQTAARAVAANHANMQRWGAYNLLKVAPRGPVRDTVGGYVTSLMALAGRTPRAMEALLGLRRDQLGMGADIYRLRDVPGIGQFEPRGYTTLVDGLRLRPGLQQDAGGFRPGQGAWQITLTVEVAATLIASLGPDQTFEPGIHPAVLARYRRG